MKSNALELWMSGISPEMKLQGVVREVTVSDGWLRAIWVDKSRKPVSYTLRDRFFKLNALAIEIDAELTPVRSIQSTDKALAQHVAENLRQMHNAAMNAEMEE